MNFKTILLNRSSLLSLAVGAAMAVGVSFPAYAQDGQSSFSMDQIIFLPNEGTMPLAQDEIKVELTPEVLEAITPKSGEVEKVTFSDDENPQEQIVTDTNETAVMNEAVLAEQGEQVILEQAPALETAPEPQTITNADIPMNAAQGSRLTQGRPQPILEGDPDAKDIEKQSSLNIAPPIKEAKADKAAPAKADISNMSENSDNAPVSTDPSADIIEADLVMSRQELFWKTLEQTYLNNPTIKSERESVRLAYEKVFEARTGWLPNISAEAGITSSYVDYDDQGSVDGTTKSVSIGVSQPIYKGGRVQNALKREEFIAQSTYYNYLDSVQLVLLDYISAYIDVVTAKARLNFNAQNVERIERQNDATQNEFDVGLLTLTDVSQSKARLAQARSDLIQAEGYLQQRLAIFTEISGLDLAVNDFVFPDINFDNLLKVPMPKTLAEAQHIAYENNPSKLASRMQIQAAQADIEANESELYPEIALSGSIERQDTGTISSSDGQNAAIFGLVANIPLYDSGLTRSRIRQSKIAKFSQWNNDVAVERDIKQSVTSAWQDFLTAEAVLDSSTAQLDAALTAREGVYSEREVGARTVLDALDADQELLNAQVLLVTARRNLLVGKFSLLASMGYLTPDVLPLDSYFSDDMKREFSSISFKQLFSSDVKPMDNF